MKILVIDDDQAMTDLLEILLEPLSSEVIKANVGLDGVELAKENHLDVVILDLMMPDVDGWQICKQIRDFSQVPILILSALDNPGLIAEALNVGADDYLIKPVTKGMLIARINKLMRRNSNKSTVPGEVQSSIST
jgi:DNA-binding response OmpR family regulator